MGDNPFRWDDGRRWFFHVETGEPAPRLSCPAPHIPDIAPYRSPVSGEYIGGRRSKRADLDRHGCIDAADMPSPTGKQFRNRKFAEKRGLTHMLRKESTQ
jgi:hypothetical protein